MKHLLKYPALAGPSSEGKGTAVGPVRHVAQLLMRSHCQSPLCIHDTNDHEKWLVASLPGHTLTSNPRLG